MDDQKPTNNEPFERIAAGYRAKKWRAVDGKRYHLNIAKQFSARATEFRIKQHNFKSAAQINKIFPLWIELIEQ